MSALLKRAEDESLEQLERIRQELAFVDAYVLGGDPKRRILFARTIAASYVWLAAVLERFISTSMRALLLELDTLGIPIDDCQPGVAAIAAASHFDSLKALKALAGWRKRAELLGSIRAASAAKLADAPIPRDSRTIRTDHLATLWQVFGFKGSHLPTPIHRQFLEALADARNELAHGHIDPIAFGRARTYSDALQLLSRIEDIVVHVLLTANEYLSNKHYLR
jgi:hypothetical protein